jgi:hypothetical protein
VSDHLPCAFSDVGLVDGRRVCAEDREQTVLPRLREVQALRLLLRRRRFVRDVLKLAQALRCRFVARISALLDSLEALTELAVDEARVVLRQLPSKYGLERRGLVGGCG